MKKISKILVLAIFSLALLAACDNSFGVFKEILSEKEQLGTDQFKNALVKAIAEDTTHYYALMSKVFYRTTAGSSWSVLPIGSSGDIDYFCSGFASDGAGTLYFAITDTSLNELKGVWKTSDSGTSWTSIDASALSAASGGTRIFDALYAAQGSVFALAHTKADNQYTLYASDGSTAFSTTTNIQSIAVPVLGVVHDGTDFWAMTSEKLYKGSTATNLAEDVSAGTPSGNETLRGLLVNSSQDLIISTNDGQLYTYDGIWNAAKTVETDVQLGAMTIVPIDPADGSSALLSIIAKHNASYGYFEWNAATDTKVQGSASEAVFSQPSSNYTTTIYGKPILSLHYSSVNRTIFAGLAAQGTDSYALYANTFTGGAWSGWTAQ
jgi:hypothetical protein